MAERFWGVVTNRLNVVGTNRKNDKADKAVAYQKLIEKEAVKADIISKGTEGVNPEYLKRRLSAHEYAKLQRNQQKAFLKKEAQYKLGIKKRPPIMSRQELKSSLSSIGRAIETQKASFDMARSRTAGTTARSIVEPPRRHLSQENFFEHKDELEVYGDEGLTFFDSNKKGNGQRTGELFGF